MTSPSGLGDPPSTVGGATRGSTPDNEDGRGDQVRDDTLGLAGEPVAGAAEPGLDLVGDEDDAVLAAPVGHPGQEARRRHDEAALALDRLDDHRGAVRPRRPACAPFDERSNASSAQLLRAGRPAERVGHRHAVDLAGERAEAVLVGHVLRRQRHREVGPAVVGVVERDDRRAGRWRSGRS